MCQQRHLIDFASFIAIILPLGVFFDNIGKIMNYGQEYGNIYLIHIQLHCLSDTTSEIYGKINY